MTALTLLGGFAVQATAHHPVYDATTKSFTYAADLRAGDKLLGPDGHTIEVTRVRDYEASLPAYNLEISGIHTYYVKSGPVAVLVHNSCDDAPEVLFGQRRVSPDFSNGGDFAGRSIHAVAQDLKDGRLSADGVRINAFWHDGQLISENTRSLTALSMAGLRPTNITILDSVPGDVLARLSEDPLVGGPLPSRMVAITLSQSDLRVAEIVTLPEG
jgi:hypothetical protein